MGQMLRTKAAAALLGVSESFLNHRRVSGDTAPFIKLGSAVLYDQDLLLAWAQQHLRHSTSGHTDESRSNGMAGPRVSNASGTCPEGSEGRHRDRSSRHRDRSSQ